MTVFNADCFKMKSNSNMESLKKSQAKQLRRRARNRDLNNLKFDC
jgi:hypothetical protein